MMTVPRAKSFMIKTCSIIAMCSGVVKSSKLISLSSILSAYYTPVEAINGDRLYLLRLFIEVSLIVFNITIISLNKFKKDRIISCSFCI